jgi:hypothetical protein
MKKEDVKNIKQFDESLVFIKETSGRADRRLTEKDPIYVALADKIAEALNKPFDYERSKKDPNYDRISDAWDEFNDEHAEEYALKGFKAVPKTADNPYGFELDVRKFNDDVKIRVYGFPGCPGSTLSVAYSSETGEVVDVESYGDAIGIFSDYLWDPDNQRMTWTVSQIASALAKAVAKRNEELEIETKCVVESCEAQIAAAKKREASLSQANAKFLESASKIK